MVCRNAEDFAVAQAPVLTAIRNEGHCSLRAIADQLNARGMMTRRGRRWHVSSVRNSLRRLAE